MRENNGGRYVIDVGTLTIVFEGLRGLYATNVSVAIVIGIGRQTGRTFIDQGLNGFPVIRESDGRWWSRSMTTEIKPFRTMKNYPPVTSVCGIAGKRSSLVDPRNTSCRGVVKGRWVPIGAKTRPIWIFDLSLRRRTLIRPAVIGADSLAAMVRGKDKRPSIVVERRWIVVIRSD